MSLKYVILLRLYAVKYVYSTVEMKYNANLLTCITLRHDGARVL